MNDLEMYRESLALCDDKIIDALVDESFYSPTDNGYEKHIKEHLDRIRSEAQK